MLFETYSDLIPKLTVVMERVFPKEEGVSNVAYTAALRAKVLDCLRGLLPASAMTNMGVYGNGRFFETLIGKLHGHPLTEMQEIGKAAYQELGKVIPSFIRRSDQNHRHYKAANDFKEKMTAEIQDVTTHFTSDLDRSEGPMVQLIRHDTDGPKRVATAMLFENCDHSLLDIQKRIDEATPEELNRILEAASSHRENRRQKSPRALEHATYTFEIVGDFGIYRDLQRHRILTQERQSLSCNFGYYVPSEIEGTDMEKPYREAMDKAKEAYDLIADELPEEAQYVVPMAYNIRWYFHVNLRALQWLCELRSSPAGHVMYRLVAQELARQVSEVHPEFERFFKFVDYEGHDLGRLGQEIRKVEKQQRLKT